VSLCVVRTSLAISPAHAHRHAEPSAGVRSAPRAREESAVRREKRYYVYVLASKSRVLYVGVTGFLLARVLQHKSGECEGLTPRYKVNHMVHFADFQYANNDRTGNGDQEVAAEKKVALLEASNPSREDLAAHGASPRLWQEQIPHRVKPVRRVTRCGFLSFARPGGSLDSA
jgi:putative endonuclease